MKLKNWSLTTRFLHLGMVLTVSFQLLISLIMVAPDEKGGVIAKLAFDAHEIVGLSALAIILVHWGWSIRNRLDGGLTHLFPWFGDARKQVIIEAKNALRGQLPPGGNRGGLPGLIHGFGLLTVTVAALVGGILFIIFPAVGEPGFIAELFAEIHESIAVLVWVYWIAHAGMGIVHQIYESDNLLKNMFSLSR